MQTRWRNKFQRNRSEIKVTKRTGEPCGKKKRENKVANLYRSQQTTPRSAHRISNVAPSRPINICERRIRHLCWISFTGRFFLFVRSSDKEVDVFDRYRCFKVSVSTFAIARRMLTLLLATPGVFLSLRNDLVKGHVVSPTEMISHLRRYRVMLLIRNNSSDFAGFYRTEDVTSEIFLK